MLCPRSTRQERTGGDCLTSRFMMLLTDGFSSHKINENEMHGACGPCGEEERCVQRFGGET